MHARDTSIRLHGATELPLSLLGTLGFSLGLSALAVETQFREQPSRRDHLDATIASTVGEPLVASNEGALLELCRRSEKRVASVINVSRPERLECFVIGCETSEVHAGEVDNERTGWDEASQIDKQQEKARTALFVGDRRELIDSDVREEHFKSPPVNRQAHRFKGTNQVRDGVNRVGIHNYATHGFSAYLGNCTSQHRERPARPTYVRITRHSRKDTPPCVSA